MPALVIAACGCWEGASLESGGQAITNGVPDEGDPAVVALLAAGQPICTGTLVAPRAVVTAAHCIGAVDVASFGSSVGPDEIAIDIVFASPHGEFDRPSLRNDIGIVLLSELAPDGVEPVPMLAEPPPGGLLGAPIRLVGFGSDGAGGEPIKREGTTVIAQVEATRFSFHPSPSQTCLGDSGGPALLEVDGIEYLAGVTSSGDPVCVDHGTDTRVDAFAEDFVASWVAATAPGAAAVGERCFYDAHCAEGTCRFPDDAPSIGYCAPPCSGDPDCPVEMACSSGVCVYDSPSPGALGALCAAGEDCDSGLCVAPAESSETMCAAPCLPDVLDCPESLSCLPRAGPAGGRACFPEASGGCRAAGSADRGALVLVIGLSLWLRRRRRLRH
jgi:hypothetical protein